MINRFIIILLKIYLKYFQTTKFDLLQKNAEESKLKIISEIFSFLELSKIHFLTKKSF